MRQHWKRICLFPYTVGRKVIERQKHNRANYVCLFIIFSVVWYGYLACLLILNGQIFGFSISNSTVSSLVMKKVNKYGIQLKQKSGYNITVKNERLLHDINKCLSAASKKKGNKVKEPIYIDRKKERGFACNHLMVLGNRDLGRTGNQMFQVAALLGIASFHGYTAIIDPAMSITDWFDLPNVSRLKLEYFHRFRERSCCKYDALVANLSHAHNWTLHGYYQSWRYFEGSNHIIRSAFKVKNVFSKNAADFIKCAITSDVITIGVHVRRGDFNIKSSQTRGYSIAPLNFVQRAMQYFRQKYKHVHFFIVSDDKMWCDRYLKGANVTVAPLTKTVGFDMAVLTLCDHVIVTSGSFGWWGAWIAGGDVVYWRGFPGIGTWLDRQTNHKDYYPSTWVGLP